jgi:hypothetical protein
MQDRMATGPPRDRAAAAAISQFGSPHAVADAFGGELTTEHARRTIVWFIVTGPLVGIWWLLLLHLSPSRTGLIALIAAIPGHTADHRLCRQHRSHRLQHHDRATRHPNASLILEIDHDVNLEIFG